MTSKEISVQMVRIRAQVEIVATILRDNLPPDLRDKYTALKLKLERAESDLYRDFVLTEREEARA